MTTLLRRRNVVQQVQDKLGFKIDTPHDVDIMLKFNRERYKRWLKKINTHRTPEMPRAKKRKPLHAFMSRINRKTRATSISTYQ